MVAAIGWWRRAGWLAGIAVVFYFLAATTTDRPRSQVAILFMFVASSEHSARRASDVRASFVTRFFCISNSNKTCMAQCPEVVFAHKTATMRRIEFLMLLLLIPMNNLR